MDEYDKRHEDDEKDLEKDIREKFLEAILQAAVLVTLIRSFNKEKPFRFEDYPSTAESLKRLLDDLSSGLEDLISSAAILQWDLANMKNDSFSDSIFGDDADALPDWARSLYYARNEEARAVFMRRRIDGMDLSDRVWNLTLQFREEIEMAIDIGLRDGLSADQMSRRLRRYLNEPERLFRRVRDEHGVLHLSKAARAYHPGTGVYRSSYKNARRLAATETNIAYRTADNLRWQQQTFVVGIEIMLSNNHTCNGEPFHDICDELMGRYPKDFVFTGWHPLCRCIAVPVLKTDDEVTEDVRKILAGERPSPESANAVKDVPAKFTRWIEDNRERISRAKSLPYFMRDNEKYIPQVDVTDEALAKARKSQEVNGEIMKAARPTRIQLTDEQKAYRKELQREAIARFKGTSVNNRHDIRLTASGIKEYLNQPHDNYFEKNELVLKLDEIMSSAKYLGINPAYNGKDIVNSHIYETEVANKKSWLVVREYRNNEFVFYGCSSSPNIKEGLIKESPE